MLSLCLMRQQVKKSPGRVGEAPIMDRGWVDLIAGFDAAG
jgi:hypothetical protein